MTFRTQEMNEKYDQFKAEGNLVKGCNLCEAPSLTEFNYWRIVDNRFPYDRVAKTHHMILPKRCVTEENLTDEEKAELKSLRAGYVNENYEFVIEPTAKMKSIPLHMHLHLIVSKD
ncbi:MAG TPA: hypothetical protein VG694_00540 [Candidatus Paceibacterota bacterium]|nr:hypothetical protein [Candidatus Paceibacterota bacterium]